MNKWLIILAAPFIFIMGANAQRTYTLEEGVKISQSGNYLLADSIFMELTKVSPSAEVNRAMAYNYSWWDKQKEAIRIFKSLINRDKGDIQSYLGLGYTYIYQKEYANAYYTFNAVLSIDPSNMEAMKGLAYKYLYEGKIKKSEEYFNALMDLASDNIEYHIALGRLKLLNNQNFDGVEIASEILQQDPNLEEAAKFKNEAIYANSKLELTMWGGVSNSGSNYSYGLRAFQAWFQPKKNMGLGVRLDNSLVTDNYNLFRQNVFAPTIWISSSIPMFKNFYLNTEMGNRFMEGNTPLLRTEIVYFTNASIVLKSGVFTDLSSTKKEYNVNCGFEAPVYKSWMLGALYYYGRESLQTRNTYRWLFTSKIQLKSVMIDGGYYVGSHGLYNPELESKRVSGFFALGQIPIKSRFALFILLNNEYGVEHTNMVFATGLKYKVF